MCLLNGLRDVALYDFVGKKQWNAAEQACQNGDPRRQKIIDINIVTSDSQDSEQLPPLVSRLKYLAEQNVASFHFPGHNRGRAAPSSLFSLIGVQTFRHDLSTLPDLDNLFTPTGPILNAQNEAAKLFGAKETWFLVRGTTCGIQASIMATCSPGDTLIIPRNSHKSAFSAMILSGAIPKYITLGHCVALLLHRQVLNAIEELLKEGQKASAVLITSPTYHGICSNLEEISLLCHSHNIPLIVDEAHGAHFGFHKTFPYPALPQGADISIQSTHKVLRSLTQSSMLHMSGKIIDRERICQCLENFQSTSPSFLLLASLDATRDQLSDHRETIFNKPVEIAMESKALIEKIPGIKFLSSSAYGMDPIRIIVGVWKLGISGFEADAVLHDDYGVLAELVGTRSITYAISQGTTRDDIMRLVSGLTHLSQTHNSTQVNNIQPLTKLNTSMRLTPRDAFFASKKKVSFKESIGEVCGELVCPYPPGISLLIPGEVITEEALNYLVELKNKGGFFVGVSDPSLSSIVVCS